MISSAETAQPIQEEPALAPFMKSFDKSFIPTAISPLSNYCKNLIGYTSPSLSNSVIRQVILHAGTR